jgi:hypothetical protein
MENIRKRAVRVAAVALLTAVAALGAGIGASAAAQQDARTRRVFENSAPIAENLNYGTFKAVPITGRFSANDPDGDAFTFEITSQPKKGAAISEGDGAFVYSPNDNARGKDSFEYVAVDERGNVSVPATVSITIRKRATKTQYIDMAGHPAQYAALTLADEGVFVGERLGDACFFHPEREVTRGEFLAMCMRLCGEEMIEGVTKTGFFDDDAIPAWVKPYISTGLVVGAISGYKDDDGKLVFAPSRPITMSEAAVVLDNILNVTDVADIGVSAAMSVPAWAAAASANLRACNILPSAALYDASAPVTRAAAAEMLSAASSLLESRDNGSLLSRISG